MASRPASPSRAAGPRRAGAASGRGPGEAGTEALLHTACVKAGAGAALQIGLERAPLLRPLLPAGLRRAARSESVESIQRRLIKAIYRRHGLKPAAWELEAVLAVAQTQAVMAPLASQEGLRALLSRWLPDALSGPLVRYTPLEPLVTATARAVAATWAAGRYADSVCRIRQAGVDWLPAPLADALRLAPSTLRDWSAEALSLALPPVRLAGALGRRLAGLIEPAPATPPKTGARPRTAQKTRKSARQPRSTQMPSRRKPQL
ncbi:hypothetical protein [Arenimonas fontis]|uniref:Uncharacterized protein n=1 Tax=Arenimonas fontis TaxID=2608255 RepID=A0A5B2ZFW4_9GAMM|nr:hypothetical protein [Arenimonas fontis]KAA2286140.1 hypothetical protein F0415_01145 [Arenimonas fontis]